MLQESRRRLKKKGFTWMTMFNKIVDQVLENKWYLGDMLLANAIRLIGVLLITTCAIEFMSEYLVLVSAMSLIVLLSVAGLDQEYLRIWTNSGSIKKGQLFRIMLSSSLSLLLGVFIMVIIPSYKTWFFPAVIFIFSLNRYCLIYCYSQDNQKLRFIANGVFHFFNLLGIILLIKMRNLGILLSFQFLGFFFSSLLIVLKYAHSYDSDSTSHIPFKSIRSIYFIQVSNNLILRGDVYLSGTLLTNSQADILSSIISLSDLGDVLPKTFNSVLAVRSKDLREKLRLKLAAIIYTLLLLFLFLLGYYIVSLFQDYITISLLILLAILKSTYFGGNIVITKYFMDASTTSYAVLNASIVVIILTAFLIGSSYKAIIGLLAFYAVTRLVILISGI